MADEDYEMDGGYEDEPMDPEIDEGAEVEDDNNEDAPDAIEGDGDEKREHEPVERPLKTSKYMTKYERDCNEGATTAKNSLHYSSIPSRWKVRFKFPIEGNLMAEKKITLVENSISKGTSKD